MMTRRGFLTLLGALLVCLAQPASLGPSNAISLKKGDVFSVGNRYPVNPGGELGQLQRFDVIYGQTTFRPELACRIVA